MEKQTLGKMIAGLRKSKNLTQSQLAQMLCITDKAVSKWERDISCPDINTIPKLAEILGVSADELLRCSKTEPEKSPQKSVTETVLGAIPLAMSAAVFVLNLLGKISAKDALSLLCIGIFSLSLLLFHRDKNR